MRIEASSSTSPFSRRSTMVSSSFSACSKLMVLMSEWSFASVMVLVSPYPPPQSRGSPQEARLKRLGLGGSGGGAHQGLDVDCGRACEGLEVIAAFERCDELASAMLLCRLQQLLGHPGEIGLEHPEICQRVSEMGVEAGRDEKEIRREGIERGKDARLVGGAEIVAVVAGLERRVENIAHARLIERAGTGKERHLVSRAVEQVAVGPERGLRAIAVMHVEIHDRHALGAVCRARMQRRDRDGVEQAEAHRSRWLGVVARRPHRAEGVVGLARHDSIDGME